MVLGLTGGVGSGKSTVADILKNEFGAALILSDNVAKDMMKKGNESYEVVVEHFSKDILDEEGNIDNNKLSKIVFCDENELNWLNNATHPIVIRRIKDIIDEFKKEDRKLIVLESALLAKSGCDDICDHIWYVCTDDDERIIRLGNDRGYSKDKSKSIFNNQDSNEYYSDTSDEIIYNNAGLIELKEKVRDSIMRLNEKYNIGL